jgi:hypothetical protein
MVEKVRLWFERHAFGVCAWWGEKLGISATHIPFFFHLRISHHCLFHHGLYSGAPELFQAQPFPSPQHLGALMLSVCLPYSF